MDKFYAHTNPDGSEVRVLLKQNRKVAIAIGTNVTIGRRVVCKGDLSLGDNVIIEDEVTLENASIAKGVIIGPNSRVSGFLPEGAVIGRECAVQLPTPPKPGCRISLGDDSEVLVTVDASELARLDMGQGSYLSFGCIAGEIEMLQDCSLVGTWIEETDFLYASSGKAILFRRGNAVYGAHFSAFSDEEQALFARICRMQSAYERLRQKLEGDLAAAKGRLKKAETENLGELAHRVEYLEKLVGRVEALEGWKQELDAAASA